MFLQNSEASLGMSHGESARHPFQVREYLAISVTLSPKIAYICFEDQGSKILLVFAQKKLSKHEMLFIENEYIKKMGRYLKANDEGKVYDSNLEND